MRSLGVPPCKHGFPQGTPTSLPQSVGLVASDNGNRLGSNAERLFTGMILTKIINPEPPQKKEKLIFEDPQHLLQSSFSLFFDSSLHEYALF